MGTSTAKRWTGKIWNQDARKEVRGDKVLELMTENALFQHVKDTTREQGDDSPSKLDLVFTRKEEEVGNITLMSPLGKSDHVVVDCKVWLRYGIDSDSQRTAIKRYNFKKADVERMKKCFRERKWFEN